MKTLNYTEEREALLAHAIRAVAAFTMATLKELPLQNRRFINLAVEAGVPIDVSFSLGKTEARVSASLIADEVVPLFSVTLPAEKKEEHHHTLN